MATRWLFFFFAASGALPTSAQTAYKVFTPGKEYELRPIRKRAMLESAKANVCGAYFARLDTMLYFEPVKRKAVPGLREAFIGRGNFTTEFLTRKGKPKVVFEPEDATKDTSVFHIRLRITEADFKKEKDKGCF